MQLLDFVTSRWGWVHSTLSALRTLCPLWSSRPPSPDPAADRWCWTLGLVNALPLELQQRRISMQRMGRCGSTVEGAVGCVPWVRGRRRWIRPLIDGVGSRGYGTLLPLELQQRRISVQRMGTTARPWKAPVGTRRVRRRPCTGPVHPGPSIRVGFRSLGRTL